MSHYTQILACTDRPTQILGGLKGLDVYFFPHTRAGTVICERTSEALDVRIIIQVSKEISWNLGFLSMVPITNRGLSWPKSGEPCFSTG